MPKYNVTMISKIADIDVHLEGIPAPSKEDAERMAPMYMARPDVWLVVGDDTKETE